jgi:prophage regulatory protein
MQRIKRAMAMSKRLLRINEVVAMVGCSKPNIYRGMKEGWFPQPLRIGPRFSAWVESEIQAWIDARIEERNEGPVKARTGAHRKVVPAAVPQNA